MPTNTFTWGLPRWISGKESTCQFERAGGSVGREDPLEKKMATHSSILAWEVPGRENVLGYSPQGRKDSDKTERVLRQCC